MRHSSGQGILKDIRILDFSWVLAGPYATRLLADFGAEVIKVQPPMAEAGDTFSRGYYNTWNRNKLGITLNLGKPAGIELARKLVKICDGVVENFSPRVMANWGLDYPELRKIKPDIILLSLSLMGHTGPWRDYSGFGPTVQAFSGITHLTTYPGEPPLGMGYAFADHVAGLRASLDFLAALEHRRQTGEGRHIDLSQTEAMAGLLAKNIRDYLERGVEAQAVGNTSSCAAPHNIYRCLGEDRWCAITVSNEDEWAGFKRALGNPAWAEEGKYFTVESRVANSAELDGLVQQWTLKHTTEDVMAILQKEGVPAGVVQDAADLAQDPQLRERGFFIELEHPELGKTTADANPIRLSENPADYRRAAPTRGQDNDYVYGQLLGLSGIEIEKLRREEVI